VFARVPHASNLHVEVPHAQLARGDPTKEEEEENKDENKHQTIKKKPTPEQERESAHRKWVDQVCKGVQKAIQSERGLLAFQNLPGAVRDLQRCIQLLKSPDPLPFHWDVSIYIDVPPRPTTTAARRLTASNPALQVQESELSGDDDEEEEEHRGDFSCCPSWSINSTCLVRTEAPPFWAVVR